METHPNAIASDCAKYRCTSEPNISVSVTGAERSGAFWREFQTCHVVPQDLSARVRYRGMWHQLVSEKYHSLMALQCACDWKPPNFMSIFRPLVAIGWGPAVLNKQKLWTLRNQAGIRFFCCAKCSRLFCDHRLS